VLRFLADEKRLGGGRGGHANYLHDFTYIGINYLDADKIDMDDVLVGVHLPVSNLSTLRELQSPGT